MLNFVRLMLQKTSSLKALLRLQSLSLTALVAACGGGGSNDVQGAFDGQRPNDDIDNDPVYTGPVSDTVNVSQPYDLSPAPEQALWVDALHSGYADDMQDLANGDTITLKYMFPSQRPFYLQSEDRRGWEEATPAVKAATETIFRDLEAMFNIEFVETSNIADPYTIAIQVNEQDQFGSAAYAYYPSLYPIGFDVFIDDDYANPQISNGLANYDYETLVHEIGHALALKHPFDDEGGTAPTLPDVADNSQWTLMTYTDLPAYFDGFFRDLDIMALADIYGVNPSFQPGNDSYTFSNSGGVFVIDGSGNDTIDAADQVRDVRINLNSETTSYVGSKGFHIVSPNQLTISANTDIENAIGGSGNDYLIGTSFDNRLIGNDGDDEIYAGLGADYVAGGAGDDVIDLSETAPSQDTYVLFDPINYNGADLVFNFAQGAGGDIVSHSLLEQAQLLDVIFSAAELVLDITGDILRLVGTGIDAATDLAAALNDEGSLSGIDIEEGGTAFLILADTDDAGETQTLFVASQTEGVYDATIITAFVGDDMDVDLWTDANFIA